MKQAKHIAIPGRPLSGIDYDRYRRLAAQERRAAIAALPSGVTAAVRHALSIVIPSHRGHPRLG